MHFIILSGLLSFAERACSRVIQEERHQKQTLMREFVKVTLTCFVRLNVNNKFLRQKSPRIPVCRVYRWPCLCSS